MGSALVPLDRALLSFYRLSVVITPLSLAVWLQFAMQILTAVSIPNPIPKSRLPLGDRGLCLIQCYLGLLVLHFPVLHFRRTPEWYFIPFNGLSRVNKSDRRTDGRTTLRDRLSQ